MSTAENIETVQAIYAAFGAGDVATILGHCADDVDWAAESALRIAGWHGIKHGTSELVSFFEGLANDIAVTEFTPLTLGSNDTGDVFVVIRFGYTVLKTGKSATVNLHHWWQLRDGKVAYYRGSEDTALLQQTFA